MFVLTVPGLASLAASELAAVDGTAVRATGSDGRADVLLVDVDRPGRGGDLLGLRLAEDVFAEVGRTLRSDGDRARWIAERIWRPERSARALTVWSAARGPLRAALSFRVIARVHQEKSFLRTDLRRELTGVISKDRPRWRLADPADLEVWIEEYQPGRFVCGLRLSDERMRQHGGRRQERAGALRPAVAAAAVFLAGPPDGLLLDPCCGSGTILAEAAAAGWQARGLDIDPGAVEAARANVSAPSVTAISVGDVRSIDLPSEVAAACVSNLPFGQQFTVPGEMTSWLREALSEMTRVVRRGGRVVLLAPDLPAAAVPGRLTRTDRVKLRLLGTPASLWAFDRR
jgi:SAM-dependent methyltransferase